MQQPRGCHRAIVLLSFHFLAVSSRASIRILVSSWELGACWCPILIEAVLQSKLTALWFGPSAKRSRRNAGFASGAGCPICPYGVNTWVAFGNSR
jgi:hypothetical protein